MFVPPAPADPPPPPLAVTVKPPGSNKALLSSIEKGAILKKVPESAKNDRSGAIIGGSGSASSNRDNNSSNNSSNNKSINGIQPNLPGDNKGGPMKQFPDMQSELLSQLSSRVANTGNATRKQSMPTSSVLASMSNPMAAAPARPSSKNAIPVPNQFPLGGNRPPPPPPINKKPPPSVPSNNVVDSARSALVFASSSNQPPVMKKVQPPIPSVTDGRPNSVVSRTTMAPPPPLPDGFRDCPKPTAPKPQAPVIRQGHRDSPRSCSVQHNLPLKINSEGDLSKHARMEAPKLHISTNHFSSNSQREAPRVPPQLIQPPPPVPMRVTNQPGVSGPTSLPSRPYSAAGTVNNQYKVTDRLPPPPPPSNSSAQTNQRFSNFDRRFKFPLEKNFPSPASVVNLR